MVSHIESNMNSFQATGSNPGRSRDRLATAGITFRAKDGYVVLAGVRSEERMRELWKVVGREDLLEGDARYVAGPAWTASFTMITSSRLSKDGRLRFPNSKWRRR